MSENTEKKSSKIGGFFKSTKGELKKIVWPSRKEVMKNTGVVLGFVIVLAILVFALDFIFGGLFSWVVNLLK